MQLVSVLMNTPGQGLVLSLLQFHDWSQWLPWKIPAGCSKGFILFGEHPPGGAS